MRPCPCYQDMCLGPVNLLSSDFAIKYTVVLPEFFTAIYSYWKKYKMAARVLLVLSIVLAVTLGQFCDTPTKFPDYNVSSCDCSGLELQKISPYQRPDHRDFVNSFLLIF